MKLNFIDKPNVNVGGQVRARASACVTVLSARRQWHDGVQRRGDQRILVCHRCQFLIEGRITIQLHVITSLKRDYYTARKNGLDRRYKRYAFLKVADLKYYVWFIIPLTGLRETLRSVLSYLV